MDSWVFSPSSPRCITKWLTSYMPGTKGTSTKYLEEMWSFVRHYFIRRGFLVRCENGHNRAGVSSTVAKGQDYLAEFISATAQSPAVLPKQEQTSKWTPFPESCGAYKVVVSERITLACGPLRLQMGHLRHREIALLHCSKPCSTALAEIRPAPGPCESSWCFSTTCCLLNSYQWSKNNYVVKYICKYACKWIFMVYFSEFRLIYARFQGSYLKKISCTFLLN